MKPLTQSQIAMVLQAVAEVEGWDAAHGSIAMNSPGEWKTDGKGCPLPSAKLRALIRRLEGERGIE